MTERIDLFSIGVLSSNSHMRLRIDSNRYVSSEKRVQISPRSQGHSRDKRVGYDLEVSSAASSKALNGRQASVMISKLSELSKCLKKTDRETVFAVV